MWTLTSELEKATESDPSTMYSRLDRILDALEPIFCKEHFADVKLSAEDAAAILVISFARAAPAREDWTDEELSELEAH
ncbi:MAG: hypothetical protein LBJ64_06030, partial [Deltaproteobacteria bacterium]|nr:hypothetical protein [Deltaproteobacteria bacterium]